MCDNGPESREEYVIMQKVNGRFVGMPIRYMHGSYLKVHINMQAINRYLPLTVLKRDLHYLPFGIVAGTISSLMVSKNVLWLQLGASGQLSKLVQHLCHVVSGKEVVIKFTVKCTEVVLVPLPEVYEGLRSVVNQNAVSVTRSGKRAIGAWVPLNKERRGLVQWRIWI